MTRFPLFLLVGAMTTKSRVGVVAQEIPASHDPCTMDQHCMNGGKCEHSMENFDHKQCVCQSGFSGPRCTRYCPRECQNGGYCTLRPTGGAVGQPEDEPTYKDSDYICKCFGHYTGYSCEVPYTNCGEEKRCHNGGECSLDEGYQCNCPIGFSGDGCEIAIPIDSTPQEEPLIPHSESWAVVFSVVLFVSFLLLLWIRRRHRVQREFVKFQELMEDPEADSFADNDVGDSIIGEIGDSIIGGGMSHSSSFKQPRSVRNWPAKETMYTNRGVELQLI